jgi:hypothetical protein
LTAVQRNIDAISADFDPISTETRGVSAVCAVFQVKHRRAA